MNKKKQQQQRKAYHSPNLTLHGDLSSLTQQFGSGGDTRECYELYFDGSCYLFVDELPDWYIK